MPPLVDSYITTTVIFQQARSTKKRTFLGTSAEPCAGEEEYGAGAIVTLRLEDAGVDSALDGGGGVVAPRAVDLAGVALAIVTPVPVAADVQ